MQELSGKAAIRQGWLGATSTLLSTAGSFYTGKKYCLQYLNIQAKQVLRKKAHLPEPEYQQA